MPRYARVLIAFIGALACTHNAPRAAVAPLEEVVVTGQRLALQRSIQSKRESRSVIDRVSADDLGKLPDRNLAEAVERLAGVSLTFDQGEGRFVAIRGLNSSLNHFTINGMSAGSPEAEGGGRRVPLDVIGSELVAAVEIMKVQTPDMDAQGIGGTVNVVLPGPFDRTWPLSTVVSARVGHDELNDERPYGGELTSAHINEARTWGWLFGVSHALRRSQTRGIYQDDWSVAQAADGTEAILPRSTLNALYDIERRRTGAHAAIEWRPSAGNRYFARAFVSALAEDETRLRYESFFREDPQSLTPTTGTSNASDREQDLRFEHKDKRYANFAIGGENQLDAAWRLDYTAQLNDNEQDLPGRNWEWRAQDRESSRWTIAADGLVDSPASAADLDPAQFDFLRFRSRSHLTQERSYIAALNLQRAVGRPESFLTSGAKYTRTDRSNDVDQTIYAPGTIGWTLAEHGHFGAVLDNDIDGRRRQNMAVNLIAADDFFRSNSRDSRYFDVEERETLAAQLQSDYRVREQVLAAYVMANWDFGSGDIIVGVRAEHTDVQAGGFEVDAEELRAQRVHDRGRYTNVLPSVSARFDLTDDLVLRAAWTHALGRPNYEHLAPISALERDGSIGSLQVGNPHLEARESANYDLALEWYFERSGLLAMSAFRKRVANEIVERFRTFDDFSFNGEAFEQFTITTTENAHSAEVRGVEASYQQQFDSLPAPFDGFGVALTYAALHSRTRIAGRSDSPPLARQPDWTRSGTLFYQKAGFELAISFAEADSFVAEIADAPERDVYARNYAHVDLRASYSLQERYGVFLEWHNLNARPALEYQGGVERQRTQYEIYGQTWYVGFALRL